MRAIWKGAVSFGLVNVPVRLFAATEEHDIRFHQVHREDGGRIRYKRTCSVCGEEVAYDDIAKGYESSDGQLVILTDEDLESLPVATGHEIDVVEFVPADQVDPILFAKSYYLEPDTRAVKPYTLLREALVQTEKMAVVKVALRQKETLAVLRVRDKAILLQTMLWPDEIRTPDFAGLETDIDLRPQELTMAASLIESMASDFQPDGFTDDYQAAVQELINGKLEAGDAAAAPATESSKPSPGGDVIDLLTALERSVERARSTASGSPGAAGDASPSTTAKAAPAATAPSAGARAKKPAASATPKSGVQSKGSTRSTKAAGKAAAKKVATKAAAATKDTNRGAKKAAAS